jgi:flagellar biosynthesis protein FliQ
MQAEQLTALVMQALELALWLSLPALGASLLVGAVTATLQSATQVQDPALSFVPRLIAVSLALFASATWMGDRLLAFAAGVLRGLPQ